jgi:hypothetical protein
MTSMAHRQIQGSCHCGTITFQFHWTQEGATIPVRACSCSFCIKHGGVYTSDPGGTILVRITDDEAVERYRFGTATADFFVCRRCGAVPVVTSEVGGTVYGVVNVNCFDNVDAADFDRAVTDFDGEGTDDRLARRTRNWTPRVEITSG